MKLFWTRTAPRGAGAPAVTVAGPIRSLYDRTFQALGNRDFRYLWLSMLMMMGAMNIQMVARGVLAYELSQSALAVGLVGAGFAPPILLFSLFGGAIADRIERKRIIQVGQLGSVFNALFIAVSITTGTVTVYHLVAASVVQGAFWAFLMPARQAIIPQLVGQGMTSNAVALNASGMSLMTLTGPAIGGGLYWWLGAEGAYYSIVLLNAGAVLLSAMLPRLASTGAWKGGRMLSEIGEGLRYVMRERTVLILLLMAMSTTVLAMPFRNLMPVFVEEVFGRGADGVGLMLSVIGLGSLIGTLVMAGLRNDQNRGLVLIAASLMTGVALLLVSGIGIYLLAVAVMVLLGLGDAGRRALNNSLIMEQSDEEHRGRVMGVYMMNFGLMPLGVIPLAILADVWGIQMSIAISGALLVVLTVAFLALTRRVRTL